MRLRKVAIVAYASGSERNCGPLRQAQGPLSHPPLDNKWKETGEATVANASGSERNCGTSSISVISQHYSLL